MAIPGGCHGFATLQALIVLLMLAVRLADTQGGDDCQHFSCGHLQDVKYPFRRRGDPPWCGVPSYELVCSDSKASIRIHNATYYVSDINYTDSSFWVMGANLNICSSNSLLHYSYPELGVFYLGGSVDFNVEVYWACFTNCSRAITNNSRYKPVACLSANDSYIYVWADNPRCDTGFLERSCGNLAMIPYGRSLENASYADIKEFLRKQNASYADIMEFLRKGFSVKFPYDLNNHQCPDNSYEIIKLCLSNSTRRLYTLHWNVGHYQHVVPFPPELVFLL